VHQYNVKAPFERIAIEITANFPESDREQRYLLIAIDYFRKWPDVYVIPNQETSTVADAMIDQLLKLWLPNGAAQRSGPDI